MSDEITEVFDYHEASKHRLDRYAPGPGGLDWATQPDPFRRYEGAPLIPLDHIKPEEGPRYDQAFMEGTLPAPPLNRRTLSQLFYDSLAISAWKQAGDVRWALRVNPSSGNLHPTEGYLICGPVHGLCDTPMVCHYAPREHVLERRLEFPLEVWETLRVGLPDGVVFIGLTSIHWRESWKYGERAFRYCQHDAGHAIAAISLAAAGLGRKAILFDNLSTESLGSLLGVFDPQGAEAEQPECLLAIAPQEKPFSARPLREELIKNFKTGLWQGKPNHLSPSHVDWPMIPRVASATKKPSTEGLYEKPEPNGKPLEIGAAPVSFRKIVHQRRSCLGLDKKTGLTRHALYEILRKTVPGPGQFPFNALPWRSMIHFGLFIHRVEDLDPGLYFLVRDPSRLEGIKAAMKKEFAWEKAPSSPDELGLYALASGDARDISRQVSCHQDIAADGCFSLGMIAEFEEPIREYGPWFYPRLFWETGLIGQVLYLEAEACEIRGTGIGCFFDDTMHRLLGLEDRRFQDLYHFTLGGPVLDDRLTTLPAYPGQ